MTGNEQDQSGLGQSRENPSRRSRDKKASGGESAKRAKLPKHQGSDVVSFDNQGGEKKKRPKKSKPKKSGQRRYRER